MVSIDLMGGSIIRCLKHMAEGSCKHNESRQPFEPSGPDVLPQIPISALSTGSY